MRCGDETVISVTREFRSPLNWLCGSVSYLPSGLHSFSRPTSHVVSRTYNSALHPARGAKTANRMQITSLSPSLILPATCRSSTSYLCIPSKFTVLSGLKIARILAEGTQSGTETPLLTVRTPVRPSYTSGLCWSSHTVPSFTADVVYHQNSQAFGIFSLDLFGRLSLRQTD